MAEIVAIEGATIKIGIDSGKIVAVPIASVAYANPRVGDRVNAYKDDKQYIVKKLTDSSRSTADGDRRVVSKATYILLCFFLGGIGVHRFMRGQVGIGVCMILFGWLTFGIWWLVDFIISLVKLSAYPNTDAFVFTPDGRWVN